MSLFKRLRQVVNSSGASSTSRGTESSGSSEAVSERSLNIYIEAASERLRTFHGEVQRIEAECISLRRKIRDTDDFIAHYHKLAKEALQTGNEEVAKRQLELERDERDRQVKLKRQLAESETTAKTLAAQYEKLRSRVDSAKQARDAFVSRLQRAESQIDLYEWLQGIDIADPTRDFDRLEQEALRQEARAEAEAEVYGATGGDSLSESIAALKREAERDAGVDGTEPEAGGAAAHKGDGE